MMVSNNVARLLTPVQPTTYEVSVYDECTTATHRFSIDFFQFNTDLLDDTAFVCKDISIYLKPRLTGGLAPYLVAWYDGSGAVLGNAATLKYGPIKSEDRVIAEVKDGCGVVVRDTIFIAIRSVLNLDAIPDTSLCAGATLTLTARASGYQSIRYQWFDARGTKVHEGQTAQLKPTQNTVYTVRAEDACTLAIRN